MTLSLADNRKVLHNCTRGCEANMQKKQTSNKTINQSRLEFIRHQMSFVSIADTFAMQNRLIHNLHFVYVNVYRVSFFLNMLAYYFCLCKVEANAYYT